MVQLVNCLSPEISQKVILEMELLHVDIDIFYEILRSFRRGHIMSVQREEVYNCSTYPFNKLGDGIAQNYIRIKSSFKIF